MYAVYHTLIPLPIAVFIYSSTHLVYFLLPESLCAQFLFYQVLVRVFERAACNTHMRV